MTGIDKMVTRAAAHPIVCDRPAPDFFEGALLGNGGLGVVVTTRPDAVVLHFGHNSVWDIRMTAHRFEELGTFQEIFDKLEAISAAGEDPRTSEWFQTYTRMTEEHYGKPYPCPMPCGSLILGFDRGRAEALGHRVDIASGVCEVDFLVGGVPVTLEMFVSPDSDRLWMRLKDEAGQDVESLFDRVKLMPDPLRKKDLPAGDVRVDEAARQLSYMQRLPHRVEPDARDAKDRGFRLSVRVSSAIEVTANPQLYEKEHDFTTNESDLGLSQGTPHGAELRGDGEPFRLVVRLEEGLYSALEASNVAMPIPSRMVYGAALSEATTAMERFWAKSAVELEDEFLERVWYWNLYFFRCAVSPTSTCPGLFANWSYKHIGTSWHGDYHMNYNTQQPFWLPFSANHVELHQPYVSLVHHLLPVSRMWAEKYYGLRGAFFPHSAYPIEMEMMPYPVPSWGWEVCETPWTVQSLWWHYVYTKDVGFLESQAFELIRDATLFMVDYMRRPEASGARWGDDKAHIFPTVAPELYGITKDWRLNADCLVDVTLTKFLFRAYLESCRVLGRVEAEAETIAFVEDLLERFVDYPTAVASDGSVVYTCVEGEKPDVVYNTPNSLAHVFPGEEYGLHSAPDALETLRNTYRLHHNEGGNELVFYHMQGARLGTLDLEKFKRQIRYCMIPNGTCTDRLLQTGGRYSDAQSFDFMSRMGIWFENFSLPAVVNECLMQSYTGVIRLFPNWPDGKRASFRTLRAVGGFLVSSAWADGRVAYVEIHSEAGGGVSLYNPWEGAVRVGAAGEHLRGDVLTIAMEKGETIRLTPAG